MALGLCADDHMIESHSSHIFFLLLFNLNVTKCYNYHYGLVLYFCDELINYIKSLRQICGIQPQSFALLPCLCLLNSSDISYAVCRYVSDLSPYQASQT
jgi:hypothetical protein